MTSAGSSSPPGSGAHAAAVARVAIGDLTPRQFHRTFRQRGLPVVLTGALDGVVPLELDALVAQIGEREFPTRCYGTERFSRPKTEWTTYCEMQMRTVASYAGLLRDGTAHRDHMYLAQVEIGRTPLRQVIGPAVEAVSAATGLRRQLPMDINLWLGPAGHTEPLHFDSHDGTLIQLRGTKRVSLFPPHVSSELYPFAVFGGGLPPWVSRVYIDRPDFNTYPRLAEALQHRHVVDLAEGEVLFIPAGWWHEVAALGDDYVCSANRFWKVRPLWRFWSAPRAGLMYLLVKLPIAWLVAIHRRIEAMVATMNGRPRPVNPPA
jgi:lysine-specific demethylase 8/hypoxia-inducible factor 1-alpha inhibitor (HIF hydroxylase)